MYNKTHCLLTRFHLHRFIHKIKVPEKMPQLRICLTFAYETDTLQGYMIGRQAYINMPILLRPAEMGWNTSVKVVCCWIEWSTILILKLSLIACSCPTDCRTFCCKHAVHRYLKILNHKLIFKKRIVKIKYIL